MRAWLTLLLLTACQQPPPGQATIRPPPASTEGSDREAAEAAPPPPTVVDRRPEGTAEPGPAEPEPAQPGPTEPGPPPPPAPPSTEPPELDAHGRDPRVVAAQTTVDRATLERHLRALVGPVRLTEDRARHQAVTDYIAEQLGGVGVAVSRQTVDYRGIPAENVIGEHRGTEPGSVVVVGAHYDTVSASPGADDNGSGVAAMLTIARALEGVATRATVRFVAFALGEEGRRGSRAYVGGLSRAERQAIEAAVVLDGIAYRDTRPGSQQFPLAARALFGGQRLPSVADFIGAVWLDDTPRPVLDAVTAAASYRGELSVETLAIDRGMLAQAPDSLRGDYTAFWDAGIPAIAVTDTGPLRSPHYHARTDTLDTLDLAFARDVTRWLTGVVLTLAEVVPPARPT